MKHLMKLTAITFLLLCVSAPSWGVLQKGDKFFPFSLISIKDEIFTVKLDEGRLSVAIESAADGTKKVIHPAAVLIDFWATWCVPCRAAMPHMQGLHDKYKPAENQESGGLILLGISIDTKGSKVVKPFYENLEYTYPMLADSTQSQGDDDLIRTAKDMKSRYKVQAIPVVYLIDSQGIIRHVHTGFKEKDIEDIEAVIKDLAAEKLK